MLRTRLIPSLLLKQGRCIKTKRFAKERDTGDPVTAAKIYDAQGADELLFLDITASNEKREILFHVIERVAEECFMPLAVGGGVRTVEDVRQLLKIGADKVAVCSAFFENPDFANEAARIFGSSTIVGIVTYGVVGGEKRVFINGKEKDTGREPVAWARELEGRGVGELLLYSIDHDGMMDGYDLDLIRQVTQQTTVPVIVCGGAGKLTDFVDAVQTAGATAVSAGSIFHFTDQNLIKARAYMRNAGLTVRSV